MNEENMYIIDALISFVVVLSLKLVELFGFIKPISDAAGAALFVAIWVFFNQAHILDKLNKSGGKGK